MTNSILQIAVLMAAGCVGAAIALPACGGDDTTIPDEAGGSETGRPDVTPQPNDSGVDTGTPDADAGPAVCRDTEVKCASGACANLRSDPNNCGACGTICSGTTPVCSLGRCVDACPVGDAGSALSTCGKSCVDKQSDPNNCGACGTTCAATKDCLQGACGCAAGTTECNGVCVNLAENPTNCGACGTNCVSTMAVCAIGKCAAGCNTAVTGLTDCTHRSSSDSRRD